MWGRGDVGEERRRGGEGRRGGGERWRASKLDQNFCALKKLQTFWSEQNMTSTGGSSISRLSSLLVPFIFSVLCPPTQIRFPSPSPSEALSQLGWCGAGQQGFAGPVSFASSPMVARVAPGESRMLRLAVLRHAGHRQRPGSG